MNFKKIEMDHYKRKSHFDYFNSLAFPYVGTTVNIDITKLQSAVKAQKLPFFLTICYCVSRAANAVPEFRQRIANGGIIEYENCRTSHTAVSYTHLDVYKRQDNSTGRRQNKIPKPIVKITAAARIFAGRFRISLSIQRFAAF